MARDRRTVTAFQFPALLQEPPDTVFPRSQKREDRGENILSDMTLLRGALLLLLVQTAFSIANKGNDTVSVFPVDERNEKCSGRLNKVLSSISTKRTGGQSLDLTGYALHQPLRSAPYDMYLTDMRIRAPGKWAKIEKCRYDPGQGTLQTRLVFRELAVTGKVKLYNEKLDAPPAEKCNMTLRMRRAGLGFTVQPSRGRGLGVDTAATFVEPQFISVHSYGCRGIEDEDASRRSNGPEAREGDLDMTVEMEEVFIRGVRSLLTRYLEHQLQPALRDTLMLNLGYSISYGR
ncbi:uncharacterized protein LOC106671128 isoform X2 [Cimex lectularius]|uniref:Uncharacterized protein n=1 Tax=Cimex lectularius TaxID=79782 RepID=A0A8I6S5B2_CIMLE|nr:uncharacterized protein LOC106671128 isoform X2 [Cimex lectularius]